MRPLLTIAIPTFNRAEKLRVSLLRVIQYSKDFEIEILVSDNASTDNTFDVVKEIQELYPDVKYYRNEKNLGFDGNFLNCFKRANGEYVWLLSDDDFILPGALESIMDACKTLPVCMHLNTSGIETEMPFKLTNSRYEENGILEFCDKNEFLEKIGIYCTFVSSLIFRVDYVREIRDVQKYFDTNILQSHVFIETMRHDGRYLINTRNCVAARENTVVHYDILKTWICNYSELLLTTALENGFDEKRMCKILRQGLSTTVYSFVISFRQTCVDEGKWDRVNIWKYIELYPELVWKYKIAVNCPIRYLKWLGRVERICDFVRRKIFNERNKA